jgi:hypothetical protein
MKIGQKVKTQDTTCVAKVFRIDGDKAYIHMEWRSKLDYISDYHEYKWFDKSLIEPLLES